MAGLSVRLMALGAIAVALACGGPPAEPPPSTEGGAAEPVMPTEPGPAPEPGPPPAPQPEQPAPGAPGWKVRYSESFESPLPQGQWQPDPIPDDGRYSDNGAYFAGRNLELPAAMRASVPFGQQDWLTLESYTRAQAPELSAHAQVVTDPADSSNQALRLASPEHTDATVVRPTQPLPEAYRISLRVGFADFGDGKPGLNGYDGGETAEPWLNEDATTQNGFYWLAILDAVPRPHNNVWIHHHRKVVVDSDNHYPPWMEIFDGQQFVPSGEHPVMLFALDGRGQGSEHTGKPFLSWANGQWQPPGAIRAVDAYLPGEWYQVTLQRKDGVFTVELTGRFKFGGQRTYSTSINAAEQCVFHFNRTPEEGVSRCEGAADWPAGQGWPDYFMFGDPHSNFYEGAVLYDDLVLEVWE